jgi:hypothetical protein
MPAASELLLYRIVKSNPPTLLDFTSKLALGLVDADADPETKRLESGLSMYRTASQARKKARAFPFLGRYIAAVRVEASAGLRFERTTDSRGHHTVWGSPEAILGRVVTVEPVAG